jgi:hypothetical protein
MINTVKVALSAIALAALVAAPAVAKSRTQQQSAPASTYSNHGVYGENHNLGTDPDARVRSEIVRDGNAAYESAVRRDRVLKSSGLAGALFVCAIACRRFAFQPTIG